MRTIKVNKDLSGSDARRVFFGYNIKGGTRKSLNRVGKLIK
jgi:hypothetical protein